MSERNFKVNEVIDIIYQAPNKESGLSGVVAEIILPDGSQDSGFPDVALVEILSKGIYKGQFTPDQGGDWEAVCHKSDGDGQVVKRYSVGSHNVHSVGAAIADVDADVAILDDKVDALPDSADVNAEVDQALVDYDAPTKAELDAAHATTDGKIDDLDTKVSSLDTPPMVS